MISKLVKFEARSTFRLLVIVWAALMAVAILIGVFALFTRISSYQDIMSSSTALYVIDKIISTVTMILYVALFVAQIVLTLAIVILRFYRGMLGDEGYLMHTLPVKTGDLITSKGIVASAATLGSIVAGAISILIMVFCLEPYSLHYAIEEFTYALEAEPLIPLYILEGLILLLVSIISGVYQIYASMAVGQLVNRHRILLSLGVYIGIGMVFSTLGTIIGVIAGYTDLGIWIEKLLYEGTFLGVQLIMLILFISSAVPLVVFHILIERILSRRLNLL